MPSKKASSKTSTESQLAKEVQELSKEIRKLKGMDVFRVFTNPWKFMGLALLKGVMVGFGSVLGASVVVGIFVYLLSQISFVPYVGDFVEQIVTEINVEQGSEEGVEATENDNPDKSQTNN